MKPIGKRTRVSGAADGVRRVIPDKGLLEFQRFLLELLVSGLNVHGLAAGSKLV